MKSIWSEDNVNLLKECVAAGMSASQIAAQLSRATGLYFSRNAIIGKIHRLQLELVRVKSKYVRPPRKGTNTATVKLKKTRREMLIQVVDADEPQDNRVSFAELASHHCRWPHDGDGEFVYCGADRLASFPYCAHHAKRAYNPQ